MSSQQLDEEAIFDIAKKLDDMGDRGRYLDQVCAGDQALRTRVEALLDVHENEREFLNSSPAATRTVDHSLLTERLGATIGRYKLMEQIGEGGMGTVFVAEQQRPIRRKVALKVVKPGMDSKSVIARFEAERQALALMDHPNISKVLDAGTTESGRPYFVMELVRGIPITEYCDQNKLTIQERLDLFIQVCQAIQHAHQKGIIHRDIKPSNVLVTLHDGRPVPKVIDFGVAKALNTRLTDKTIYTEHFQVIGTLLYMSPEQAELSGIDIDTRSDVYGLGVLLYELLTGTTPFQKEELNKAGFDEQRRLIREQEPPRASVRISSLGETATAVAEHRRTDSKKLNQLVRGDLDWIVLKALEKDRTRRYETANGFAADIERLLADEVIMARPPLLTYRVKKFARRNRVAVATAILVGAALLLGVLGIVWQAGETKREAEVAKHALEEAATRLASMRDLVIERAMLQAVAGEFEQLQGTIQQAEAIGVPEDWLLTLRGVYHIHQGQNKLAIDPLQRALDINPANVSAKAMLSLAYFHNGDWDKWAVLAPRIKRLTPRDEYDDFDSLFIGYGWFYIDYAESAKRLDEVLDKHPSWYVPRTLLAGAWAHAALMEDGTESLGRALAEVQAPRQLAGDNPFVIMGCLYVYRTAILKLGPGQEELERTAEELAHKLDHYPDYPVGGLIRARYYETVGDDEGTRRAWNDTLRSGSGVLTLFATAALLSRDEISPETILKKDGTAAVAIAQAYLWALSDNLTLRKKAMDIFEEHKDGKDGCDTWVMRSTLIQIPLLLHDVDAARKQAEKWLATPTGNEGLDDSWWDKESLEFLTSGDESRLDVDSVDLTEQFYADYQSGFLSYAEADFSKAAEHFSKCAESLSSRAGFRRLWARALAQQAMKRDGTAHETPEPNP